INGLVALETPLASADDFKVVTAELPANTLQPGSNLVRFEVVQRHRTDCTVQSTYELWTQVDPAATLIDFKGDAAAMTPATLEDLPAVGYDASGRTTIHILTSRTNEAAVLPLMLRLAQAIALYGQYPNPSVVVGERKGETDGPGTLTLLVAPTSDLAAMTDRPPAATGQPMVSFLPSAAGGPSVLAITGADWSQIQAAIDAVALRVDRPLDVPRTSMDTASWFAPNVHFFTGAEAVPFADLGVPTQQFSGRRLRVEFGVGIPSDFYAEAYGEATILLDAAYTPAVLPASHIDVYVNGQIAATTRIVTKGGGIFRHFPINLPLRNFHPGVNRITLEAVLDTADDRVCGPGGSIAGPDRFALFDTSEFSLPSFARIGRRPDLAAFAGTGSPYNRQVAPSALVVPRTNSDTIAAASTLVARLAIQAGRIVPVTATPMAGVGDRPAIFIGATGQMPPELLRRLGISDEIRTAWKPDAGIARRAGGAAADAASPQLPGADRESTDVLFDEWRNKLSDGGGWRGQVSGI
ncbi:MAG: cellulose biosynthesis cyclic di-GMP-binding regulatory protein BcsB, partial [Rhizobiales bacterium]|nr:cellulose biosynthesis cyclic di-GMP-binding regulatory protein BcsB [Hyphomicrobiales bacterium]